MTDYPSFNPTSPYAGGDDLAHRTGTLISGSNASGAVTPKMTLVGVVTASGKYKKSVATATDGSQNPVGFLADDVDASSADAACNVYEEGQFTWEMISVDASWTLATLNRAFESSSRDIFIRSVGAVA